jgi:hypothetical protein
MKSKFEVIYNDNEFSRSRGQNRDGYFSIVIECDPGLIFTICLNLEKIGNYYSLGNKGDYEWYVKSLFLAYGLDFEKYRDGSGRDSDLEEVAIALTRSISEEEFVGLIETERPEAIDKPFIIKIMDLSSKRMIYTESHEGFADYVQAINRGEIVLSR